MRANYNKHMQKGIFSPKTEAQDSKLQQWLFLILTVVCGIILQWPYLDFQPLLAPGDHGHDLYSFQQVYEGKIPYQDFWWVYGPLMPFIQSNTVRPSPSCSILPIAKLCM